MQAIVIVALPLIATPKGLIPKRITERTSIYLKTPRLIKQCHSLPYSVLRMRKGQCKHFECGFTPVSNPKMIKRGNKIGIYLCKRTKVKSLTWRTLGFSEYGLINASIVSLTLPLTATPKGAIKRGNKIDMYLCKKKMQC